jgi:hypothetical protein
MGYPLRGAGDWVMGLVVGYSMVASTLDLSCLIRSLRYCNCLIISFDGLGFLIILSMRKSFLALMYSSSSCVDENICYPFVVVLLVL